MSFVDLLVKQGKLSESDAQTLIERAQSGQGDLDDLLRERQIPDEDIVLAKSEYTGVPVAHVVDDKVPFEVLKFIPEESASHYQFIPLALKDGILEVGMVDPDDIKARDALQFISNRLRMPFRVYLIGKGVFDEVIHSYRGLTGEITKALSEIEGDDNVVEVGVDEEEVVEEESQKEHTDTGEVSGKETQIKEDAPVTKIVSVMLRHAVEGNASDVHIEHMGERVRVRFRVDGELFTSLLLPKNVHPAVVARIKILSKLKLDEKRKPQDGRFSAHIDNRKVDFRVSTFPAHYGEKIVMRILDSQKGIRKLEELGLSVRNLSLMKKSIKAPYGIILITGPTGSGKSTTLYSMINAVDREKKNVVSLEDPVEYNIPGMAQSQVRPEIGYTFASGLRSILRQDPDVIMVGEIRDKETAQLAIQAALTGHLVFATLHTNSAVGAIPRLVDMGVDPFLIAPTLVIVIAQRLARLMCPTSKKALPANEAYQRMVAKQFADLPEEYRKSLDLGEIFYEAVPSAECPGGTRGRAAIMEILEVDKDVEKIILDNPVEPEIWKMARQKGMLSMREDGIVKAYQGVIPFEEINKI
jgi:type IV pilus assembly protein PilB